MEHTSSTILSRRSSTHSLTSSSEYSDESFSSDPSFSWADDSEALPPLVELSLFDCVDVDSFNAVLTTEWTPSRPPVTWSQEQALRDAITFAFTGETPKSSTATKLRSRNSFSPTRGGGGVNSFRRMSPPTDISNTTTTKRADDATSWRRTEKGASWRWNDAKGGYVLVNNSNNNNTGFRTRNTTTTNTNRSNKW